MWGELVRELAELADDQVADADQHTGHRARDDQHGQHARHADPVEPRHERAHQERDECGERNRYQDDLPDIQRCDDDRNADEACSDLE